MLKIATWSRSAVKTKDMTTKKVKKDLKRDIEEHQFVNSVLVYKSI